MGQYLEALLLVIAAVVLLWFGYTLFFGRKGRSSSQNPGFFWTRRKKRPRGEGLPGAPQTCPVCCAKLVEGELVKSRAFPSLNGGNDRLMHIRGCLYCLKGERKRNCPVCGISLTEEEFLVARMFERPRRPHVHILGCSRCRRV